MHACMPLTIEGCLMVLQLFDLADSGVNVPEHRSY
jgi:hypothetical protein